MGVFGLPPLVPRHGDGCYVWDVDGNRYLDLVGGIAVNALGHGHPALVSAVVQAGRPRPIHISNLFTSEAQISLAERLIALAGAPEGSAVFFANSGAEAIEAAIKLSRRTGRTGIVARPRAPSTGAPPGALALTAQAGLPRAVRAAHPRRHPRALRRRRRAAGRGHRRDRRRGPRAHPGRGRRAAVPARHTSRVARERDAAARRAAHPRRDPDRHRPHRIVVRLPAGRASLPTPSRSPRASAAASPSARSSPSATRRRTC